MKHISFDFEILFYIQILIMLSINALITIWIFVSKMAVMVCYRKLLSTKIAKIASSLTPIWLTCHEISPLLISNQFSTVLTLCISFLANQPLEFLRNSLCHTIESCFMLKTTNLMDRKLLWAGGLRTTSPGFYLGNHLYPATLTDGFPVSFHVDRGCGDNHLREFVLHLFITNSIDIALLNSSVAIVLRTDKVWYLSLSFVDKKCYVFKHTVFVVSMPAWNSFTFMYLSVLKTYVSNKWVFECVKGF